MLTFVEVTVAEPGAFISVAADNGRAIGGGMGGAIGGADTVKGTACTVTTSENPPEDTLGEEVDSFDVLVPLTTVVFVVVVVVVVVVVLCPPDPSAVGKGEATGPPVVTTIGRAEGAGPPVMLKPGRVEATGPPEVETIVVVDEADPAEAGATMDGAIKVESTGPPLMLMNENPEAVLGFVVFVVVFVVVVTVV